MPEKINFTKKAIVDLEPPEKGRVYIYDTEVPALCICVSETGTKVYYRYGRVHGRPTRIRIGRHPEWTPRQAREECRRLTGEIADRKNPAERKRRQQSGMTIRELFDWVLENHSKPNKRTWKRDQRQYELTLAHWGHRRIRDLATAEIREHHTHLRKTKGPYGANKMRELLRLMYSIAIENDWVDVNPVLSVKRAKVRSRKRFLTVDEMGRFLAAVQQIQRETTRDFLLILLYTGARRDNAQSMRWDELDLDHAIWLIPAEKSKGGEPMAVVLVDQAVEILHRRQEQSNSEWVFPGHGRTGHIVEPKAAFQRVLELADIKDLRIHDLRRTLGSWQARLGASLPIIGDSLGHRSLTATQVYARLDLDPVRESVSRAVNEMEHASKKISK